MLFEIVCFHFSCSSELQNIQQTQKDIFPKMFLETVNLFFQPKLLGKKRDYVPVHNTGIYPPSNIIYPIQFR